MKPNPYLRADQREYVYSGSWEKKRTRAISSGPAGPVWVAENFESKSALSKPNPVIWILNRAHRLKPIKEEIETLCAEASNFSASWNENYLQEMGKAVNKQLTQ